MARNGLRITITDGLRLNFVPEFKILRFLEGLLCFVITREIEII